MRGIETVTCDFRGNFRKCQLITRHRFSSTDHCTRRAFGWRIVAIRSPRERNRSRIRYRPLTNCKKCSGKRVSCNFSAQSTYSYGKTPLRVNNSNSSSGSVENFERIIFNLFLSRLVLRNLKESIKRNFTQFLWELFSVLSLVLSTCFVKEMYFSLVIRNTSTRPSYAVAISLIIKCAS